MKKFKGAILSQNHRRSQGGGPGVKKAILIPFLQTFLTNIKQTFFQNKHFFSKTFQNNFFPKQTFFSKFYKNRPAAGGFAPRPP